MKALITIIRVLLGAAFVFFGLNGFFFFLKMPPPPPGPSGDFTKALFQTHYYYVVAALQIIGGALLIIGSRFVPLGLLLLGPVVVNILCFHIFMDPKGLPMAIVFSALTLFLLWAYRAAFAAICPWSSNRPAPGAVPTPKA